MSTLPPPLGTSFDIFFFYGSNINNVGAETSHDILEGLLQPKRTYFYNRQDGSGLTQKENYPNGIAFYIACRYEIVQWIAYRNNNLPNVQPDRRVASSQTAIEVKQNTLTGEVDIEVKYIPFADFKKINKVSLPIGRGV